jgi:hypothetical protein
MSSCEFSPSFKSEFESAAQPSLLLGEKPRLAVKFKFVELIVTY